MDKKKALLTSLATLSLVAAANPVFAEETTSTPVPEPTVAAEAAPADAPVVDAPVADAPVADAPAVDAPAADAPAVDAPAVDAPVADAPVADTPAADTPAADAPAADPAPSPETSPRAAAEPAQVQGQVWRTIGVANSSSAKQELKTVLGGQDVPAERDIEAGEELYKKWIAGTPTEQEFGSGGGRNSISSAVVEFKEPGFGITVEQVEGYTVQMPTEAYRKALEAAGAQDIFVKVAGNGSLFGRPIGTAALAGVYEIVERVTGVTLDSHAGQAVIKDAVDNKENYSSDLVSSTPKPTAEPTTPVETPAPSPTAEPTTWPSFDGQAVNGIILINRDGGATIYEGSTEGLSGFPDLLAHLGLPTDLSVQPMFLASEGRLVANVVLPAGVSVPTPETSTITEPTSVQETTKVWPTSNGQAVELAMLLNAETGDIIYDGSTQGMGGFSDLLQHLNLPTDLSVKEMGYSTRGSSLIHVAQVTLPKTETAPVKDVATIRNELLLDLDASNLTDAQKSAYAEEIAAAETPEALAAAKLSIDRLVLLLDLDASKLTDAQKAVYAEEIAAAETPEALAAAKLSYERFALLLDLDASALTDAQKSDLAEKIAAAETAKDLAALKAEFVALTKPAAEEAKTTATPVATRSEAPSKVQASQQAAPAKPSYSRVAANADKGFLPSTGEAASVLGLIGVGLSALGLVGIKRRR